MFDDDLDGYEVRTPNPVLYMTIGIPGSGKTRRALELKAMYPNLCYISSDLLIEEYAANLGKTYNDVFSGYIKQAQILTESTIAQCVKNKQSVILDQTNLSFFSRKRKLEQFKGYWKIALVFNPPDSELHERILMSRTGKIIPLEVVEKMKKMFQFPTFEEFDEICQFNFDVVGYLSNER